MRGVWRKLIKGKSKFEWDSFPAEYIGLMAFNKQRYTKEQAITLWYKEQMLAMNEPCVVEDTFVRYRFGMEEGEQRSCWWHEWEDYGSKSVPVWSIRSPYSWEKDGSVEEV